VTEHDVSIDAITLPPGWTLHFEQSVGSTQDLARDAAGRDLGSRHVFLTDFQSAGRGRLGRTWTAPPGSALMFTALLREPHVALQEHTVCVSVSLCQAIESLTSLRPDIKWPNDLLVSDRKVCGVLAEATDAAPGYVAVGLGLNLRWDGDRPAGIPAWATALGEHLEDVPARGLVLQKTIGQLDQWLSALTRADEHGRLREEWLLRLWRRDQSVDVKLHDRLVHGVLIGTDEHGALVLRTDGGGEIRVLDGELILPNHPPRDPLAY
jgi:BirA family biotin operon repressor/biotin-[acetyl-CoA-carboxylase] ligase